MAIAAAPGEPVLERTMQCLLVEPPRYDMKPVADQPQCGAQTRGDGLEALLIHVLDEIDYGLIVVDDAAQVRFGNQAALRECGSGLAARVCDGIFSMRDATDQRALEKALWAARRGARSLLAVNSPVEERMLAVVPLRETAGAHTLLVFGKGKPCEPVSMSFFALAHKLSHAESAVLRGLCEGLQPQQIARDTGVAISTVRTQIGSIRSKTRTHSIRELITRITSLPPIIPTLRPPGMAAMPCAERAVA